MSKSVEELQAELQAEIEKNANSQKLLEQEQIKREAAESLLRDIDIRGGKNKDGRLRDSTGSMSLNKLIEEGRKSGEDDTDDSFQKEVSKLTEDILSKVTEEQLQDPSELKKLISVLQVKTGSLAHRRALTNAIDLFQKAVNIKTNIDAIIANWRRKNPDLANPEDEDLVEWIMMNKIAPDPINKNKTLETLIDLATEKARETIKTREEKARSDGRSEAENRGGNKTLTPGGSNAGIGSSSKENKEVDLNTLTDEQRATRYLSERSVLSRRSPFKPAS